MISLFSAILYGLAALTNYFTGEDQYLWESIVYTLYSLGFLGLYVLLSIIAALEPRLEVYMVGLGLVASIYAIYPAIVLMVFGGIVIYAIMFFYLMVSVTYHPKVYGYSRFWGIPKILPIIVGAPVATRELATIVWEIYNLHKVPNMEPLTTLTLVILVPVLIMCLGDIPPYRRMVKILQLLAIAIATIAYLWLLRIEIAGFRIPHIVLQKLEEYRAIDMFEKEFRAIGMLGLLASVATFVEVLKHSADVKSYKKKRQRAIESVEEVELV
ncbi:MAG: hypothetical protein QXK54_05355 [Ignisphaera sp.]